MTKTRLEAFSDGVLAIIITIMVLELKVPHDPSWNAMLKLWPVFASYIISFLMVGIYWGNHHHLIHTINKVSGGVLWSNLHLLFWLSLIPFATGWAGENHFEKNTVAFYALVLNLCGLAYYILLQNLKKCNPNNKEMKFVLQKQSRKGLLSLLIYSLAIAVSFFSNVIAIGLIVMVGILWLIPDKNIESAVKDR